VDEPHPPPYATKVPLSRLNVFGHVECSSIVVATPAKSVAVLASTKPLSGLQRRRSTDHWLLQHLVQWTMASKPSTSVHGSVGGSYPVVTTSARIWITKELAVLVQKPFSKRLLATVAALFCNLHYLAAQSPRHVDTTVNDQRHAVIHKCLTIVMRTTRTAHAVHSWWRRLVSAARRR